MQNITKEYLLLFNTITDINQELNRLQNRLIQAQEQAEELYMQGQDGHKTEE